MTELRKDILQRHLEAFEEAMGGMDGIASLATLKGSRANGAICRAAIDADWFTNGFNADKLGEMTGGAAATLAGDVVKAYQEAVKIDPN